MLKELKEILEDNQAYQVELENVSEENANLKKNNQDILNSH